MLICGKGWGQLGASQLSLSDPNDRIMYWTKGKVIAGQVGPY